jgi:hypothetical protein
LVWLFLTLPVLQPVSRLGNKQPVSYLTAAAWQTLLQNANASAISSVLAFLLLSEAIQLVRLCAVSTRVVLVKFLLDSGNGMVLSMTLWITVFCRLLLLYVTVTDL